jgi:MoxR-like ATPase
MNAPVADLPGWTDLNRHWLIAALARLRQRLAKPRPEGPFADCVEATPARDFTPALLHCAQAFGLSAFERELLLLLAGLDLDQGLRAAVARLNGGASARASFGLAFAVLTRPHWDALSPEGTLRRWRMVELEPDGSLALSALGLDERVLHFITGVESTDAALAAAACLVRAASGVDADDQALVNRIARLVATGGPRGPVVVLQGQDADPAARRDIALAVAAHLARPALWIEARDLPGDGESLLSLAIHVDREAALIGCLPVLSTDNATAPAALALAGRLSSPVLWLGAPHAGLMALPRARRVLRLELPPPDAERTRRALLGRCQRLAAEEGVGAELNRAARQFHLGPTALDEVVERLQAAARPKRAAKVWPAAREAARGGLDSMAQRIEARASFDDLVLPVGQSALLRDITRHLRQRDRVFRDWGFGVRYQLGQGLVALFTGESGTGKTLAAEAIANEVELDLYRIDLATVVSKYIGETEKNLKRLFAAAEASGAVLLFDEADALFGKRSEVKDSHDRYANIEIAYLLQRVEAYRGLAILTTNMKSALDHAFLRRIRFVVSFPVPDLAAREQIWRRQFPAGAPLGEIDYAALAKLNLAGGNIRSIALNAAFKAADAGGCIEQTLLMAAAREEFARLERTLTGAAGGP